MAESFSYSEQKGILNEMRIVPSKMLVLFYGFAEGVFMQQSCHKFLVLNNGPQSLGSYLPYHGVSLLQFNGKVCLYICVV